MFEKDAVALVTGAATGIGLETATAYAQAGCRTVLCDRDAVRGAEAAERLRAATGEASLANFYRVINVNLRGVFACMREQIRLMLPRRNGAIVNIASVAGLVGFAGLPAYCASKGGVVQLTRAAAVEYGDRGIRVNAVCPGVIKTEMVNRITRQDPAVEAQYAAIHPMNRMGTPREIADTVVWLCSSQAGFVTGQALAVDGGLVAR